MCKEDDVRDLLPVQAYSQKQLSAVGIRTEELIRFIEAPVKKRLQSIGTRVEDLKSLIRSSYDVKQQRRKLQRELEKQQLELESLTKQVEALTADLTGVSAEDKDVLSRHDKILREERLLDTGSVKLTRLQSLCGAFHRSSPPCHPGINVDEFHNKELISAIHGETVDVITKAKEHIDAALEILEGSGFQGEALTNLRRRWKEQYDLHIAEQEAVKRRASVHETKLRQIEQAGA